MRSKLIYVIGGVVVLILLGLLILDKMNRTVEATAVEPGFPVSILNGKATVEIKEFFDGSKWYLVTLDSGKEFVYSSGAGVVFPTQFGLASVPNLEMVLEQGNSAAGYDIIDIDLLDFEQLQGYDGSSGTPGQIVIRDATGARWASLELDSVVQYVDSFELDGTDLLISLSQSDSIAVTDLSTFYQTLTRTDVLLSISNGNSIILPAYIDSFRISGDSIYFRLLESDSITGFNLDTFMQDLIVRNDSLIPTGGTGIHTDEIDDQTLSLGIINDHLLTIDNGNTIQLPDTVLVQYIDTFYTSNDTLCLRLFGSDDITCIPFDSLGGNFDFWRTTAGALPDGVNDSTEAIWHGGIVTLGYGSAGAQVPYASSGDFEIRYPSSADVRISSYDGGGSSAGYLQLLHELDYGVVHSDTDPLYLSGDGGVIIFTNGIPRANFDGTDGTLSLGLDNDPYTFPPSDGAASQVLVTDGAGTLTFQDQPGSGVTIGLDNEIPFVNATNDDLEYSSNITWNGARLELDGTINQTSLLLQNGEWLGGRTSGGSVVRIFGVASSTNHVFLGAVDNAGGDVFIREDGSNRISIVGGDIGIGTDVPSTKLDVNGNGRFRSVGTGTFANLLGITSDGTLTTATPTFATQSALNDTAAAIRSDFPGPGGTSIDVHYDGATLATPMTTDMYFISDASNRISWSQGANPQPSLQLTLEESNIILDLATTGSPNTGTGVPLSGTLNINPSTGIQVGRSGSTFTITNTAPGKTDEEVQDIVGGMVSGNTETGINVTYDDVLGNLDFVVTAPGDNLGNHTATTTLDMNGNNIIDGGYIDLGGGSTVVVGGWYNGVGLNLNGAGHIDMNGSNIYLDGGTVFAGAPPSDSRIKKDVNPIIDSVYEKILGLNPITFKYTDEFNEDHNHGMLRKETKYGYLAQEYEKIFPDQIVEKDSIFGSDRPLLGIADGYEAANILTTAAVQQLIKDNQELKEQIAQIQTGTTARLPLLLIGCVTFLLSLIIIKK